MLHNGGKADQDTQQGGAAGHRSGRWQRRRVATRGSAMAGGGAAAAAVNPRSETEATTVQRSLRELRAKADGGCASEGTAVHKEKFQFLAPKVDRHGIHEIRGPLSIGGAEFLASYTHFFRDIDVSEMLTSKQRFQAYLEFREQAFKIAAAELSSAFNSPADLFLFTAEDGQQFLSDYLFHYTSYRDTALLHFSTVDDQSNESGDDSKLQTTVASADDHIEIHSYKDVIDGSKSKKESLLLRLHYTQRYFVYRKGLMKLNISQFNNDLEKALEWLKSSTGWSGLTDYELRRGLESHMKFLEEHEISKTNRSSISESERVALERINAERASELKKKLEIPDWEFMIHYYDRMKLRNLARVCSIEAQTTGVILVQQALPVREICKEQILSTSPGASPEGFMKETVKRLWGVFMKEKAKPSFMGCLGSLHQIEEKISRGIAGRMAFLFVPVATVAAVAMPGNKHKG